MQTQKRILPKNIQNLLNKKWEGLSENAKKMILSLLQENDVYKNKAIKEAIKNEADFANLPKSLTSTSLKKGEINCKK